MATTTYHFILTVQRHNGPASTRSGLVTFPTDTTRQQFLRDLISRYCPGETVAVLFFDLQPNQL